MRRNCKGIKEGYNMTLREFLCFFDFDYIIHYGGDSERYIQLIDLQCADFGDIESEKFDVSSFGIVCIIERMDTYYNDYIFTGLSESLHEDYQIEIDKDDWHKIYTKLKELNLDWDMDILPYIFGDRKLCIDEIEYSEYKMQ